MGSFSVTVPGPTLALLREARHGGGPAYTSPWLLGGSGQRSHSEVWEVRRVREVRTKPGPGDGRGV